MKKGNKILIIALIIITVLVLGGVAVLYFTTDMLKTDEKLFYKYLAQVVSEDNGFIEKDIENLQNKKNQNAYENSGSFTVKTEGTGTDDEIMLLFL